MWHSWAGRKPSQSYWSNLFHAARCQARDLEATPSDADNRPDGHRSATISNATPPAPGFLGRDDVLESVRVELEKDRPARGSAAVALVGYPGVGKSQIARRFLQDSASRYTIRWWINASSQQTTKDGLINLGSALGHDITIPEDAVIDRVLALLSTTQRWIVVFDNAEAPESIGRYVPAAVGGHVLITSLNESWSGIAEPISVRPFDVATAAALLTLRSGDGDTVSARRLAEHLGCLPLALDQAGIYASQQRITLASYLAHAQKKGMGILKRGYPLVYPASVYATIASTLDRVSSLSSLATVIMNKVAFCATDQVPIERLGGQPPDSSHHDALDWTEAVAILGRYGLITGLPEDPGVHSLTQAVCRDRLAGAVKELTIRDLLRGLAFNLPNPKSPDDWPRCRSLFPHVQAALSHASEATTATVDSARLRTWLGTYLTATGADLDDAILHLKLAVDVEWPSVGVTAGRELAACMTELGAVHRILGQYDEAFTVHSRALAIMEVSGQDSPGLAALLSEIAHDLHVLGRYEQARDLHFKALALWKKLNINDSRRSWTLENLAVSLRRLGHYEQSRDMHIEALALWRTTFQGDRPEIAWTVDSLAYDYHCLGAYEKALEMDREALAIRRRLYVGDNPEIAWSLDMIGSDLRELNDIEQALQNHRAGLEMRRRLFGDSHPTVARSLSSIAKDHRVAEEFSRALEFEVAALETCRVLYPDGHPDTARSLSSSAADLRRLDRLAEAATFEAEALEIRSRILGESNHETQESRAALGLDLESPGDKNDH